jgi:hypothetical protein
VIARAGPYCNAETNGGGLALWGSDGSLGNLRTSDVTYYQAWLPWITNVGEILAKNEITKGGVCLWSAAWGSLLIVLANHSQPNRERAPRNDTFRNEYTGLIYGANRGSLSSGWNNGPVHTQ